MNTQYIGFNHMILRGNSIFIKKIPKWSLLRAQSAILELSGARNSKLLIWAARKLPLLLLIAQNTSMILHRAQNLLLFFILSAWNPKLIFVPRPETQHCLFFSQGPKHFNFIPKTFLIPHEYSEFAATHHRTRGQLSPHTNIHTLTHTLTYANTQLWDNILFTTYIFIIFILSITPFSISF